MKPPSSLTRNRQVVGDFVDAALPAERDAGGIGT
jgi:hypothetical protein